MSLFGLLASGHINENPEHYAIYNSRIIALSASGNPARLISPDNAEINLIRANHCASGSKSGSHAVAIRRVDVRGQIFKTDIRALRDAPHIECTLIRRESVCVDVPRPQSYSRSIDRKAKVRCVPLC